MLGDQATPNRLRSEQRESEQNSAAQLGRVLYLRKLYFLVFLQLFVTSLVTGITLKSDDSFASWLKTYTGVSVWLSGAVFIFVQFGIFFSRTYFQRFPLNWALYLLNAAAVSILVAYLQARFTPTSNFVYDVSVYAAATVFLLLTHAVFAKYELNFQSATLYILAAIYTESLYYLIFTNTPILNVIAISFLVTVWGFYLVWDNETVVPGVRGGDWARADYTSGASSVYIDTVVLSLSVADQVRALLTKTRTK